MLSKFIAVGNKIEIQPIEKTEKNLDENGNLKTYYSTVYDILSEDSMEITMPMEQTKLILLPIDSEFDMVFYGATGLFQCLTRIVDRYKSNNVYILVIELVSNLRKYQRREYYRFSCALEMCARNLEEEELQALEQKQPYELQEGLPLKRSVIVDISGGGLRFMSEQKYEEGSLIYCSYYLTVSDKRKKYEVIGKVLAANELGNRPGIFEHRVQYYNMDVDTREEIIKYIFEEERKGRKKERLG
ncbi:MAG: flagellar brake protein [Lachnospiraceae bacterium]|nr:flagellar brake protein [Lachnospiraceae bacterium]